MSGAVLLVRHTEVARRWRGRCYGISNAGLSRGGAAEAIVVARQIADWRPDLIIHSGLRRAARLADLAALKIGVRPVVDPVWQERNFGAWEGRLWSAIYRVTGDAMNGIIEDPDGFRPGGGETTTELADRATLALANVPSGRIAVVTHGGPIGAILGRRAVLPPSDWLGLIPMCGATVEVPRRAYRD